MPPETDLSRPLPRERDEAVRTDDGLSSSEAERRLASDGPNELAIGRRSSLLHALRALVFQPLFLLLFAAAAVYTVIGDALEAAGLMASVVVAAGIAVFQDFRTERVLLALRDLSSPRAVVWRDGQARRLASRDVVEGDLLLLHEGDRVPADARVVDAHNLRLDESLLTGEPEAVRKFGGAPLFANTLVVAGTARAVVTATGARTQFGLIGGAIQKLDEARSPLQRDTARLARLFGVAGGVLCMLVVFWQGLVRDQWIDGVMRGLTLALAILPEEFPLVITVFLAIGSWRLAQQRVLTRRPGAIEALGATTVLCVDKTGTLTVNRMEMATALPQSGVALGELAGTALKACEPRPFDPMERACARWAHEHGAETQEMTRPLQAYPMRPERMVVAYAWAEGDTVQIAAKGAPEHVFDLCGLVGPARDAALAEVQALARTGIRVLAVASAVTPDAPEDVGGLAFRWLGLLGFRDPLRSEVPDAVAVCRRAGIRILMITGDYPLTARAVAVAAGLAESPRVVGGQDLDDWSDAELVRQLPGIDVVARATPLVKLRLVQALQGAGEVVAMTGDGVNDAPALRAAHIGVAMGERGSDVAREAASLVLLQDDFQSLVAAVRLGRRIFANLRQALLYVLAVHVPMIGMSLLPLVLGAPPMLLPLHVMFLEFVIDPACSLVFEAEADRPDSMCRGPRPPRESVLGVREFLRAMLQGAVAFAAVACAYGLVKMSDHDEDAARTVTVTVILLMNLVLILHNRSRGTALFRRLAAPNPAFWAVVATALVAWTAVLHVSALRTAFRLAPLSVERLPLVVLPVLVAFALLEGLSWWTRSRGALRSRKAAPMHMS